MLNVLLSVGALSSWLNVVHRFSGSLPANDPAVNQRFFRTLFFFPDSINNVLHRGLNLIPALDFSYFRPLDVPRGEGVYPRASGAALSGINDHPGKTAG